jgi:hypothetical protein
MGLEGALMALRSEEQMEVQTPCFQGQQAAWSVSNRLIVLARAVYDSRSKFREVGNKMPPVVTVLKQEQEVRVNITLLSRLDGAKWSV